MYFQMHQDCVMDLSALFAVVAVLSFQLRA